MNATKALSQLGFVTARGLDNGEYGALLLSNKVKNIQLLGVTQYLYDRFRQPSKSMRWRRSGESVSSWRRVELRRGGGPSLSSRAGRRVSPSGAPGK